MGLKISCPVCSRRLTVGLDDGIVYCPFCGYQPLYEWQHMADAQHRVQTHPLSYIGEAEAYADMIKCPNCGGDDLDPVLYEPEVRCRQCNHQYSILNTAPNKTSTDQRLRHTHLQRKLKAEEWEITERLLDCHSCGAQLTLNADALNEECLFCGSHHVLIHDTRQSFQAPDMLIPFQINGKHAHQLLKTAFNKGFRKITKHLEDGIERIEGKPLFLPWWIFEIEVDAYYTVRGNQPFQMTGRAKNTFELHIPSYASIADIEQVPLMMPYDFTKLIEYTPQALAQIQAEIYQVDVTEAAPVAIHQAKRMAKGRLRQTLNDDFDKGRAPYSAKSMAVRFGTPHARRVSYYLILLPVWVILMHETDGDIRRALVNGQTGKVHVEPFSLWGNNKKRR